MDAARHGDLVLSDITFAYPALDGSEGQDLLRGLSFGLSEGCRGVVLGRADAGKSTLCRILGGLVPRFTGGILSGTARFQGIDLLRTAPYDGIDTRGFVFQDPDEQIFTTRCDTEAAFGLESLGIERREMEQRVYDGLELMGLRDFQSRNPGTLSGGEKKRLMISCLAALRPRMWVLDEVFQELDAGWRDALIRHLVETGATALFLDSRWNPVYATGFEREALLTAGAVRVSEPDAGTAGREARLAVEGMLIPPEDAPVPPASPGPPVLRVEGLRFSFGTGGSFGLAVDDFELAGGSVCALLGRNGSGKTTLARLLCGLLQPQAGRVSLRGSAGFRCAAARELRREVGYLFQNPDYQVFLPSVSEELAFGMRAEGVGESEIRAQVEKALGLFRLPPGSVPPALLSYGTRKRLQAATYFLLKRRALILDEIDSGLSYGEIIPLMGQMAASGSALVLITHDVDLARYLARRIIVMESGSITQDLQRERFGDLIPFAGREG
jgi:energy-coupling factor transport system ATP-binding protein